VKPTLTLPAALLLAFPSSLFAQDGEKLEGVTSTTPSRANVAKQAASDTGGVPVSSYHRLDFEQDASSEWPDGKIVLGPGAGVVKTNSPAGRSHLQIQGLNQPSQDGLVIENIPVAPSTPYQVSFQFRTTENMTGRFQLRVEQSATIAGKWQVVSSNLWYPDHQNYAVNRNTTMRWTRYTAGVNTVAGASRLTIRFRTTFLQPAHQLHLDDIRLETGPPAVFVKWEIDPKTAVLTGSVTPSSGIAGDVDHFRVFILRDGRLAQEQTLSKDRQEFRFDLSSFTDGVPHYISAYAQLEDGNRIFQAVSDRANVAFGRRRFDVRFRQGFDVPLELADKDNLFYTFVKDRPWEGNRIGLLEEKAPAPAPWTSLVVADGTPAVTNWNNHFTAGPGLGSMDIAWVSPRQRMTRAPATLTLDGQELPKALSFTPVRIESSSPTKVVLSSQGKSAELVMDTRMSVEFDGFTRHTLTIRPVAGKTATVRQLTLTMKFPAGFVTHHFTNPQWNRYSDAPELSISEFRPRLWFGNFETGVEWCTHRIYPAVQKQSRPWATMKREGDGSTVTLNLVNDPTVATMEQPLVIEFGLLPTPCKPANPRLRNVQIGVTHEIVGAGVGSPFKYYGYPELTSPADFDTLVAPLRAARKSLLYYFASGWAMETLPQMTYFKKEWLTASPSSYASTVWTYMPFATGDTKTVRWSPSWIDLCLSKFKELVEQTGIQGAYWDTAYPRIDEDENGVFYPVFEAREFHKRAFIFLRQKYGEQALLLAHISGETYLPYTAFSDIVMNGEHFRQPLMQHTQYSDVASLDEMRATFGSHWGPERMFLPQYWHRDKAENRALMAQVGAFAFSFDSLVKHPIVAQGKDALSDMLRKRQAFGDLSHATWHPYWKPNPVALPDNPEVWLSLYERDGDLFVTVFNPGASKQELNLSFPGLSRKDQSQVTAESYDPVADKVESQAAIVAAYQATLEPFGVRLLTIRATRQASQPQGAKLNPASPP
jgi:hypothetical protein